MIASIYRGQLKQMAIRHQRYGPWIWYCPPPNTPTWFLWFDRGCDRLWTRWVRFWFHIGSSCQKNGGLARQLELSWTWRLHESRLVCLWAHCFRPWAAVMERRWRNPFSSIPLNLSHFCSALAIISAWLLVTQIRSMWVQEKPGVARCLINNRTRL